MAAGDPILAADYALIKLATIQLPVIRMVNSVSQALASGGTAIAFASEVFDTANVHNTGSNTTRVTPTNAGYWRFAGGVYFATNTTIEAVWLRLNGVTTIASGQREGAIAVTTQRGLLADALQFMNGTTDYIELIGDPGAAINTNQSQHFSCWLEGYYLGRQAP
jgi:hypothetical protein